MTCKLCGEDKKLVDAHVIPRSFHRIDCAEQQPSRLLTNVEGRYSQKVRKGIYDSTILCETCERRFGRWDDYADQLFIKSWEKFERLAGHGKNVGFQLASYDYKLLKMFFLSVLWRAAVSQHLMFSKIKLGPREEVLRKSVWDSNPGDVHHFGVVLQAFDTTEVGILDPHLERFSGVRFCRIYLSHVIAFIKVDARPFEEPFRSLALDTRGPLVIVQKNFLYSPERRIMRDLVFADKAK